MFDPVSAIVLGTVALAGGGYQAYSANRQRQAITAAAEEQKTQANILAATQKRNTEQAAMRLQARRGAIGEPGTRDTILTSPLGVTGTGQTGSQKTLLGT